MIQICMYIRRISYTQDDKRNIVTYIPLKKPKKTPQPVTRRVRFQRFKALQIGILLLYSITHSNIPACKFRPIAQNCKLSRFLYCQTISWPAFYIRRFSLHIRYRRVVSLLELPRCVVQHFISHFFWSRKSFTHSVVLRHVLGGSACKDSSPSRCCDLAASRLISAESLLVIPLHLLTKLGIPSLDQFKCSLVWSTSLQPQS